MAMTVHSIVAEYDRLRARVALEVGDLLLPAYVESSAPDFCRLLARMHLSADHAAECLEFASNPAARPLLLAYGIEKAKLLLELPAERRAALLSCCDIARTELDEVEALVVDEVGNLAFEERHA